MVGDMNGDRFEAALHDARRTGNWSAVISLYTEAAQGEGEAFYLTHAYVHALEAGDVRANTLKARLIALGAEMPDQS